MSPNRHRDRDFVEQFAQALDGEDYQAARMLLSAKCIYNSTSGTRTGPAQVIESYKSNGDWAAAAFDSIRYESHVEPEANDEWMITFTDHIHHKGKHLVHKCGQILTVNQEGLIETIEHRDIRGEKEKLEEFLRDTGINRPQ